MADTLNTPTLSELHHPVSRRALVQLAAAGAALAAAPAALAASSQPDAELLAACERWHAGHQRMTEMIAKASRLQAAMVPPAIPQALFESLELGPGQYWPDPDRQPENEDRQHWTANRLAELAAPHSTAFTTTHTKKGDGLVIRARHVPVSEETRRRAAGLLPIAQEYERQRQLWQEASEALEDDWQELNDQLWNAMLAICAMPVRTPAGLLAKVQILLKESILPRWDDDDDDGERYALGSLGRDIEQMAALS